MQIQRRKPRTLNVSWTELRQHATLCILRSKMSTRCAVKAPIQRAGDGIIAAASFTAQAD